MGSGNHSRTYLYQTELGEIFELPLQWYSQTGEWGMSPGFEGEDHHGVGRLVQRECMFCHNAYPEVPSGSDDYREVHLFPKDLPQGIGCQRCHGPGAEHVRAALAKDLDQEAILGTIVNPAKLEPQLRDDVCNQCHLQPTVSLFGVRQFDRGDYSYRPGEPLPEYLVQMDVDSEGMERAERFEINHHAYRLYQSPCYLQSEGEMSCVSCHDPHRKIPAEERAAHYRTICLECHSPHSPEAFESTSETTELDDCVVCHMPKRRPQDVVKTLMTDHRIGIYPDPTKLLEPIEKKSPILTGIEFYSDRYRIEGPLGEIYKAVAVLRAGGNPESVAHLRDTLRRHRLKSAVPYLDLIEGLLERKEFEEADFHLGKVLTLEPENPLALEWRAVVENSRGNTQAAIELIDRVIADHPDRPAASYNRGLYLYQEKRLEEARIAFEEAIGKRPNLAIAHFYLGKTLNDLARNEEALSHLAESLRIEPTFVRAAIDLGQTLISNDRIEEASRYLSQALKESKDPETTEKLVGLMQSISTTK
jgi:Tfp pilus assembly protein PilF